MIAFSMKYLTCFFEALPLPVVVSLICEGVYSTIFVPEERRVKMIAPLNSEDRMRL